MTAVFLRSPAWEYRDYIGDDYNFDWTIQCNYGDEVEDWIYKVEFTSSVDDIAIASIQVQVRKWKQMLL